MENNNYLTCLAPETVKLNLPTYCSSLLNMANQTSQGTSSRNIGSMNEFYFKFLQDILNTKCMQDINKDDYDRYFEENFDQAKIDNACIKSKAMLENFKKAIDTILEDENIIRSYIVNLVKDKTYEGLSMQESIFKSIESKYNLNVIRGNALDESKGIDGYINNIPVQVKPKKATKNGWTRTPITGYLIEYEFIKSNKELKFNFDYNYFI